MDPQRTRAASLFVADGVDRRPRMFSGSGHLNLGRYRTLPSAFGRRVRPAPPRAVEDPGRVTDFSIERILSADMGNKAPMDSAPALRWMAPGSFIPCVFYPSHPVMNWVIDPEPCPRGGEVGQGDQGEAEQGQQQWKPRVRTVFTDRQLQRLEELFERTRYPRPETRAEVARSIGLSEDTVRIWFKNHRARRKRKTSASQSSQDH